MSKVILHIPYSSATISDYMRKDILLSHEQLKEEFNILIEINDSQNYTK